MSNRRLYLERRQNTDLAQVVSRPREPLGGGAVFLVARYAIPLSDHAMKRFEAWLDPFAVSTTSGWQILQGLVALYSGGIFGVGVGAGVCVTGATYAGAPVR